MTTSRYIARLMGPVLLLIGIGMVMGMLTEGDAYSSIMKESIGSRALIFITGALALLARFDTRPPRSTVTPFRGEPQGWG